MSTSWPNAQVARRLLACWPAAWSPAPSPVPPGTNAPAPERLTTAQRPETGPQRQTPNALTGVRW